MYSRFTFVENTISNSPKVPRAKFLGSDELFCFSNICKFGSFKNPFAMIISLSELYFRFTFALLAQTKVISMKYGSSTSNLTIEMSDTCPDSKDEGYIHQFQPEPTQKIHLQQQKH